MTQNSNSSASAKHLYKGEDFDHSYKKGDFAIYLRCDAKNNVFKTRYECPTDFIESFESIAIYIQDKNLDDLVVGLASDFKSSPKTLTEICALLHFRESFYSYRGDLRGASEVDSDSLICRCMGIDKPTFEKSFLEANAQSKELLKNTNVNLICGNCSNIFKQELALNCKKHNIFEGKKFSEWKKQIEGLLLEFHYYSPKEFENIQIEVEKVELPELTLVLICSDELPDESKVKNSLTNYLGKELNLALDIKISFRN